MTENGLQRMVSPTTNRFDSHWSEQSHRCEISARVKERTSITTTCVVCLVLRLTVRCMQWQDFVGAVQTEFQRGDWSIPELPAKELIHRIYRDVRFSQDKTPYKRNFSASFSRTGCVLWCTELLQRGEAEIKSLVPDEKAPLPDTTCRLRLAIHC